MSAEVGIPLGEVPSGAPGKERRTSVALISEGLPLGNRSGWVLRNKERPRRSLGFRRAWTGRSAVFGSSPQPSGLPRPAGRFHRGATGGELNEVANGIDRCRARWNPPDRRAEWRAEPSHRFSRNCTGNRQECDQSKLTRDQTKSMCCGS